MNAAALPPGLELDEFALALQPGDFIWDNAIGWGIVLSWQSVLTTPDDRAFSGFTFSLDLSNRGMTLSPPEHEYAAFFPVSRQRKLFETARDGIKPLVKNPEVFKAQFVEAFRGSRPVNRTVPIHFDWHTLKRTEAPTYGLTWRYWSPGV